MLKNNYQKNLSLASVVVAIILTLAGNIIFAIATAEPIRHFDSFTYLIGYNLVQTDGVFAAWPYVGKFPEVFLQSIYYIIGVLPLIKDEYDILILHSAIFNLFYIFSVFIFTRYLKLPIYYGVFIYALTLPGTPLQLGRQAIYLAVAILIFLLFKRFFSKSISGTGLLFVTPFFHLGSIFVPLQFLLSFRQLFMLFASLTFILLALNSYFEYATLAAISPVLILKPFEFSSIPFNLVMPEILILGLFLLNIIFRQKINKEDFFILFSLTFVVIFVNFPAYRLLFGFFFFFFPFAVFKVIADRQYFNHLIVLALLPVILFRLAIIFYSFMAIKL